ncbi:MAG: hypothetical protein R2798_13560 [Chitinophagales bacterium]
MKNRPHPYRITIVLACWLMTSAWLYAQTDALTVNIIPKAAVLPE